MQRIVVVGIGGSGKSTLAQQLAERLDLTMIEPDGLFWEANWQQADRAVFRARVAEAIAAERWVFAGNYSSARDLTWTRADTLIWLDYAFTLVFWRLFRRTVQRIRSREDLWGTGNVETWRKQFTSTDSLFVWLVKSYGRYRRQYPLLVRQPEYAHLHVIHFTSPRAADIWLQQIQPTIDKEHV